MDRQNTPEPILTGVRVLDFGRFIAAPYCAALLGYLGAEVIRIEQVDGNTDRYVMPVTDDGEGSLFLQMNHNKRSLALDMRYAQAREIRRKLVATSDVVVTNPVLSPAEILKQPQRTEGGYFNWTKVRGLDDVVPLSNPPVRLSETVPVDERAAPVLGHDTSAILSELGYRDPDISELRRSGVV